MKNIAVVIPIHGRHELSRRVIAYYATLDPLQTGCRLFVVPVMDEIESDLWNQLSPPKAFALNEPLGHKFNEGIRDCQMYDIDGVMIVGSDDLVSPAVFRNLAEKDPMYQEIRGVHFFNSQSGEMVFERTFVSGAGKYFSREVLDTCQWSPYDEEGDRNLDSGPNRFLGGIPQERVYASLNTPMVIDIKTVTNMWDWNKVLEYELIEAVPVPIECFLCMNGETTERWTNL